VEGTYSVVIIGEQPVSRAGMEKLISEDGHLRVLAAVGNLNDLDPAPAGCDVVVLDLPLRTHEPPPLLIQKVARIGRPLVCSSWEQPPSPLTTIRSGAYGCITRYTEQVVVREALRAVARGGFYLCPRLAARFQEELTGPAEDDSSNLAPREAETLKWIAMGYTHRQIATRMGLSQATVNTYAKRIRAKLNVNNKAELTRMAIELGHLAKRKPGHADPAAQRNP
jgi:DNA-binding NarL/FixJ family response regulator